MAEYQRVEFILKRDGTITERVLSATGDSCYRLTEDIEKFLAATVESRTLINTDQGGDDLTNYNDNIQKQGA